jgi:hypothetical protein
MILLPKQIIFVAVSNNLTNDVIELLKNEFITHKSLYPQKFILIISKYFDFTLLRDKPLIPEDIWLYNYLMYDNRKKHKISFEPIENIKIEGSFRRSPLIKKYEKQVIIPQLQALKQAGLILNSL